MNTDVLIIGGGLAGIACAVGLRDTNARVVLLERETLLGGRAVSFTDARTGDVVDIGPHIFVSEYRNVDALLRMFGEQQQIAWPTDRLITLLNEGRANVVRTHRLPPPFHLVPSLIKTRDVSLRDKASNLAAIRQAMKTTEEDVIHLDQRGALDLLVELGVSQRFIDWFWRSACMALMNVPLEQCSAGALMRCYTQLIGHSDLKIGFARCGLSELFAPMADQAVQQNSGAVLRGESACAMTGADNRCESIVLRSGARITPRYVVVALPPAELASLLPPQWAARREFANLGLFEPSSYISVFLWFDRKLTDLQFWARVWSPTTLNYDFYDLSNIRKGWSDRPSVIASNIIYSKRCEHLSDEEIVRVTLDELASFSENVRAAELIHSRVHRIPMAIPCPYVGTERARPATQTSLSNVFLAGDWTRTQLPASMESAVRSGFLAAEAIRREIGQPQALARMARPPSGLTGWMQRRALEEGRRARRGQSSRGSAV